METAQELLDQAYARLNSRELGQKLFVVRMLHNWVKGKHEWDEIAFWLQKPEPTDSKGRPAPSVARYWTGICDQLLLDTSVPSEWSALYELFQNPPPTLTGGGLRQWHNFNSRRAGWPTSPKQMGKGEVSAE